MAKSIKTDAVEELFEAIMSLESKEEFYSFFEDICTTNEVLSIAERFEVAKLLYQNNTYIEIAAKTGASTDQSNNTVTVQLTFTPYPLRYPISQK